MTPKRIMARVICGVAAIAGLYWHSRRPEPRTSSNRVTQGDAGIPDGVDVQLQARKPVQGVPAKGNLLARLRKIAVNARPNTPMDARDALAIARLTSDADSTCSGRFVQVGGNHASDLVIKKYWTGTGAGYDLIVCLDEGRGNFLVYVFSGSERGITFYGDSYIPLESHLVDLNRDGQVQIVIPQCLMDRGAYTIINWPTLYERSGHEYVVADKQFPWFYSSTLLHQVEALQPAPCDEVNRTFAEQDRRAVARLVRAVSQY